MYTYIKNQPIFFVKEGTNPEDLPGRGEFDYSIITAPNDVNYYQVKIGPLTDTPSSITDPEFSGGTAGEWTGLGSAVIVPGLITIGDGSTGSASPGGTALTMFPNNNYQLVIDVQLIFGEAVVYNGGTEIARINSIGRQTISFPYSDDNINISIEDDTSYIEITRVDMFVLPYRFAYAILDADMNILHLIDSTTAASEEFVLKKDRLTILVSWGKYLDDPGCYYLALADPDTNDCLQFGIFNYQFLYGNDDESGNDRILNWAIPPAATSVAAFYPDPARLVVTPNDENPIEFLTSTTTQQICPDKLYTVQFAANTTEPIDVTVTIGDFSDTVTVIPAGSPQIYTFTGVSSPYPDDIHLIAEATELTELTIFGVQITLENIEDWTLPYVTPHPFKISDQYECSKKITIYNDEDGNGFVYDEYFPNLRVDGKIINRKYKYEKEFQDTDIGERSVKFGERRTVRTLKIEHQPNYLLDFLTLGVIADNFIVDDNLTQERFYVESDTADPDYSEELDNYGTLDLDISEPVQLVRNIDAGV